MDLTKNRDKLLELYKPKTDEFVLVDVPELPFAMIDGEGSPDDGVGAQAIQTLFKVIYPIRREARERLGNSFVEPPAEMLYWADDMNDLAKGNKDLWKWRVMITMPADMDREAFTGVLDQARKKIPDLPDSVRLEKFTEGQSVHIMHRGRTDEVPAVLERLYTEFLPEINLQPNGAYHEIYLDDWSRTAPERRKIILRQPVRAV